MSFPDRPFVGQRYTAENGQEYIWTAKQAWRALNTNGTRPKQIPYTAGPNAPVAPGLGDQWFDTTQGALKTWASNGVYGYWRVVVVTTEFEDPSKVVLTAERTLPLVWNYSEANYAFEAWSDDHKYNWRDGVPAKITRITARDDTIELESTADLVQGKRYVVVSAGGNTLAVVDILSVLSPTVARARTTFDINVAAGDMATLSRTSFDVRAGYAMVSNGDRYYSRPIRVLQSNFKGRLRLRRSAEGRGVFTVGVRAPGTDTFEPVPILETVTPGAGYRDEIYAVDRTGPVEFSLLFTDSSGLGDRVEYLWLYPAPQAVDQRRVEQPTNFSPADQGINVPVTPTLQGSAFRSLYNLLQNGAEFQIATNDQFTNLVVNSSSDFLASWVAVTGASITGVVRALEYLGTSTVIFVGSGGYAARSMDGGATRTALTLPGAPTTDLQSVGVSGTTVVLAGDAGVLQYSTDSGATFTAVTPAGGYAGNWQGVALADKYGIVVGTAGEIQRTANNAGGVYAKAPADNGYTGVFYDVTLLANGRGIAVGDNGEIQTTSDYGATWRKRTQAAGFTGVWRAVALTADGHAVVVGSSGAIQTSDDFGATWTARVAGNSFSNIFEYVAAYDRYAVAVGLGGEIQTSSNYGATWSKRTTPGASTATLYAVAFSPAGDNVLIAGNGVQFKPLKLEGNVTSYTVPAGENLLEINKVYYWRVRYQDSAGFWSDYSKPTVFATKSTLDSVNAPTNLSPAKDAVNISTQPTLQTSAFSVIGEPDTHNGSQFQISEGATFGTVLYDATVASPIVSYAFAPTLSDRKTYSWRARHRGARNGWGPWSTPTSFTVTAKPNTPTINSITENGATATDRFALAHTAFSSPVSGDAYTQARVEVATASDFATASLVRQTVVANTSATEIRIPNQPNTADTVKGTFDADTLYYFRMAVKGNGVDYSDWSPTFSFRTAVPIPVGEAVYTTPGTYTWRVPTGVTSVCAVCVGGGGSGAGTRPAASGGGGGLTWKNDIPVTPGQLLSITVGAGGLAPASGRAGNNGGSSSFGSVISATAGSGGYNNGSSIQIESGKGGVAYGGGGGGNGGYGTPGAGGGGGAAGYTGNGGVGGRAQRVPDGADGWIVDSANPNSGVGGNGKGGGGGGGGGGYDNTNPGIGGAGGGVGLYGQGANGVGGTGTASTTVLRVDGGGGGSGGVKGQGGESPTRVGGAYGGGGSAGSASGGGAGGSGAVRIIWGAGRSFPNNAA